MARKLPRWALIGGILAGATAATAAAIVAVRRMFGGGYDERPLGEPITYPAAGAGTGFPEPTSPENTERIDEGIVPELRGPLVPPGEEPTGTAVGEVIIVETAELPEEETMPHLAAGADTAGTAAGSPTLDLDATRAMPPSQPRPVVPITATPQPLSPDDTDADAATFTAVRSDPLQRPPVPLTEQQAENSARMQVHQQQLYAAFPGLQPGDIVASDGEIERLARSAADRTGMDLAAARARLNALLSTGPEQKADEGIEPDLVEPKE